MNKWLLMPCLMVGMSITGYTTVVIGFFLQNYEEEILSRACLAKAEKLPFIIEVNTDGKKDCHCTC